MPSAEMKDFDDSREFICTVIYTVIYSAIYSANGRPGQL
jgi:hypothetical protein